MENNSIRFLESRIQANQRNANALNRTVRKKRGNANARLGSLQKEKETLEEMKRDVEEYKNLVADDIPGVPDEIQKYIKTGEYNQNYFSSWYAAVREGQPHPQFKQFYDIYRSLSKFLHEKLIPHESKKYVYSKYNAQIIPQQLNYGIPVTQEGRSIMQQFQQSHQVYPGNINPPYKYGSEYSRYSSHLRNIYNLLNNRIQKLETQLIPAQEAKIQQIERNITATNNSAQNYALKATAKRNTIKATQREKAEQEENLELRKNRLYNYFKSPKNLATLTDDMWELPETMNMSKVGLYRAKNPRNIPVYTRPRKQTRRRR